MKRSAILVCFLVLWAMTASAADFAAGTAAYENKDFKRAFEIWKPLAETGDPSSQFRLGRLYDRGEGTEKISIWQENGTKKLPSKEIQVRCIT